MLLSEIEPSTWGAVTHFYSVSGLLSLVSTPQTLTSLFPLAHWLEVDSASLLSAAARRWHGSYAVSSQTGDQGHGAINSPAVFLKACESVNKPLLTRREHNCTRWGLALESGTLCK